MSSIRSRSLSLRSRPFRLFCLVLLGALLGTLSAEIARAQSWDPFPRLPRGQNAAVQKSLDGPHYDDLRSCLRGFDSEVGASYFAAVVGISAENGVASPSYNNAVPYVDALYQAWRPGRRLDPDRHVLMVMALDNRAIAIHPGTVWADLGFQGSRITRVIDGSRFGDIARDGDFGRALCALAGAVDEELQQLVAQEESRREEARRALARAQAQSATLGRRIIELGEHVPLLSTNLLAELQEIDDALGAGRRAEERGRQHEAGTSLDVALGRLGALEGQVDATEQTLAGLPDRRQELERLAERLESSPGSSGNIYDGVRERLAICHQESKTIDGYFLAGEVADLSGLDRCLEDLEEGIGFARGFRHLTHVVLPWAFAGLLLLFGLVLLWLQRRRRDRARGQMLEELEIWQTKLSAAAERLLEIERQYPLYFATGALRWTGASQPLDQSCADVVNRLYLLYSRAYELLGEAQDRAARARGLRAAPYERIYQLLRETPVRFETGSPPSEQDHRRIFLPLTEEYQGTARDLLQDLDSTYGRAIDHLEEVTEIDRRMRDLLEEVEAAASETLASCSAREALGLPAVHLLALLDPELARRDEARGPLRSDPLTAIESLASCREQLAEIRRRGELGNETVEAIRGPLRELSTRLSERLEELRGQGFRVREPGFQPDLRLTRAHDQAERVVDLVDSGREDEAHAQRVDLQRGLEELRDQLEASASARDGVPAELEEIRRRTRDLGNRIPEAREHLEVLRHDHAPAAFGAESDNLEAFEEVLARLEEWHRHIAEDHRQERYLSALTDLDTCDDLLVRGNQLVDEIVEIRSALEQARQTSRDLSRTLSGQLDRLRDTGLETPGLGVELRRGLGEAESEARQALARMEQPLPHWLEIAAAAEDVRQWLERLLDRADAELGAFAAARSLATRLEGETSSLRNQVERETRDRTHVHHAVDEVASRLEEWNRELNADRLGGSELLALGGEVEDRLGWARGVFSTEMDTVRHAESEIAALRSLLDREDRRSLGYGVVVDCREGRRALTELRSLRSSREWELILQRAPEAVRSVELEVRERRREAERREEAERRRIARERAAAAAAAAARAAAAVASSRSSRSSSRSSSGWSRSSSSSFGRSGGSSFRSSSRSGGSSW